MARRISGRSKTQKDKSGPTAGEYRPTREQLLAFIHENPDQGGKREIARAFGLKGPDRVWLKDFLRQLEDEGLVERKAKKLVRPGGLPHVVVLDIFGRGTDGELLARPSESPDENGPGPLVSIRMPRGAKGRAPGVGERVLAKVFPVEDPQGPAYTARVLKIIDKRRERAGVSEVMHVIGDVHGRHCILVDDIVDSAGTLCNAAEALMKNGATAVSAYVTHGVFSGGAVARVAASPIEMMTTTDSILATEAVRVSHNIRQITIAPLLAEAIRRISEESSVSSLFC